jgi:UDP-2,3-diacylglucosamine hydrolase
MLEIQEGAIFIADSHYPHYGEEIITLLENLPKTTPQLFLMGDIFDILFDHAPFLLEYNKRLIDAINRLSDRIEIFYFEGNHDFNLSIIFPKVHTYTLAQQPQIFQFNHHSIALAHGDKYAVKWSYKLYTKLIRNQTFIKYLPFQQHFINRQLRILQTKKICQGFKGFEAKIESILEHYKSDKIIEGHYHRGVIYKHYISLPSLVCQKKVAIARENSIEFISI